MISPATPPLPAAVARHYEELDRLYRELWGEHVHHGLWTTGRESPHAAVLALSRHVAHRARVAPGQRVCDVGCGYGGTARLLAGEYGAHVTGLTITQAQHAYAVRHTPGTNPRYLLRDWLGNALPDESFDAVIAIESTEHMADKARCLAEAFRVLRPGGHLVVCAWLAAERPARWQVRHLLRPICHEGRLPGMGTRTDYERLLAGAGFVVQQVEDVSHRVRRTWPICIRRLAAALARDAGYRRMLMDPDFDDRVFAVTMLRLWAAYHVGAMRYGIFTARRPE
ncbi:MAG TPA: methyltransferase domain-containing protein [Gemmatimonadaceae bacterium]|nr:methyltransferase domain-containing protein [Gemmatimonadaceae bacterium]